MVLDGVIWVGPVAAAAGPEHAEPSVAATAAAMIVRMFQCSNHCKRRVRIRHTAIDDT
jgi:hypothetical protein